MSADFSWLAALPAHLVDLWGPWLLIVAIPTLVGLVIVWAEDAL